jgi:hypothetical protein
VQRLDVKRDNKRTWTLEVQSWRMVQVAQSLIQPKTRLRKIQQVDSEEARTEEV